MSTFESLCGFGPDRRDIAIDAAELRGEDILDEPVED